MIALFFILTILLQGLVMGCFAYCGAKIYKLPHLPPRWRLYLSAPSFAVAAYLFLLLTTAPFHPRATTFVLWTALIRLGATLLLAAAAGLSTAFFFGWINGGSYAKPEAKDDPK